MSNNIRNDEPTVLPAGVERRSIPGRGNGLFATKTFAPQDQIVFVQRPLLSAIDTSHLPTTCYACLRPSDAEIVTSSTSEAQGVELKTCTGCRAVRFCKKACQRVAWKAYHKHECPIFQRLQPRTLPSTVRAILRLLLQREHDSLPAGDWTQLFTLESHQEELSEAGGEKWQNIFLMTKALKTYSGTSIAIDQIVQLCCILMVNSFTLTTPTFDPIGVVLHSLPALINHSCDPNAIVRFDMSDSVQLTPLPKVHHGSISVHALRPIDAGDELRITYIDAAADRTRRRSELSERYFFFCDCARCEREKVSSGMAPQVPSKTLTEAIQILKASSSQPPSLLEQYLPRLQSSMSALSSRQPPYPITSYPLPQLRHQIILALIATQDFHSAMRQNVVLSFKVDPILCPEPWHPCRVVSKWRLLRLLHYCIADDVKRSSSAERNRNFLHEVAYSLVLELTENVLGKQYLGYRQDRSGHIGDSRKKGQMELMIAQAQQDITYDCCGAGAGGSEVMKQLFQGQDHKNRVQEWIETVASEVLGEDVGHG
jgi:hypothetical protein